MTDMTQAVRAMGGTSIRQRLSEWIAGMVERRAQHRVYHSTMRGLLALSDDDLSARGIHPGDIHDIAWKTAYGG